MKKVALGMSGGVDSSVCALLLQEQGYEVIAIFMRNWDSLVNNEYEGIEANEADMCPQELDYLDAKQVCDQLGIELHKVNFVDEYWNDVFTYFLNELKVGRTPNPDLMCNKYIKFDAFKRAASKFDVDLYAFGHYAITQVNADNQVSLYRSYDHNKDQTYFLSQVSASQLEDVIFPIGHLDKAKVRDLATKYNLATSSKKDSTGICFIGERNFPQFLQNYFKPKSGQVIDITTNEVLGTHYGLVNYTIGQRKGLNIGGAKDVYYVCAKNVSENILYVCSNDNKYYLTSYKCNVKDINWINKPSNATLYCQAKFRYRQQLHDVVIKIYDNEVEVTYESGVDAVTPGQACVFYLNDECLGGGIIDLVFDINDLKMVYL